jgi:hypothetical protein
MHRTLLAKYPACTRPAIPVLAAAKNPPVNTMPGTAYSQEYSGGSVGPIQKVEPRMQDNPCVHTLEHVEHALRDDEATSDIHASKQNRKGPQELWDGVRKVSASHNEQATDTNDSRDGICDGH